MHLNKIITVFFIFFSIFFKIFPENTSASQPYGSELSKTLQNILIKNGFSPVTQELSATGQNTFAYNLTVEFNAKTSPENLSDNSKTEIALCLPQEDFYQHQERILIFLTKLKNLEKPYSVYFTFTALDSDNDFSPKVNGTEIYASSIEGSESIFAMTITLNSQKETSIKTGSLKACSPLWLTKRLTVSFFDENVYFDFETSISSLYTLGLIQGSRRLSKFAQAGIPAIEVNFSDEDQLTVLEDFLNSYEIEGTDEWDQHYFYIPGIKSIKPFFISETILLFACLFTGIISIMLLCIFSFTGKNGEQNKKNFQRSFYLIPITIGVSFLSLYFGQFFTKFLSFFLNINPVIQYGIKITFSMFFISIMFNIQERLKLSVAHFVYGYVISLVSVLNIFLFSSQNLLLFVAFIAEYLIIYFSRMTRKIYILVIFFTLLVMPFIPYIYKVIRYAQYFELERHVYTKPLGNFLLSLAIFPFHIMWLRILFLLNVYTGRKGYSMKRMFFNRIFYSLIVISFIFTILTLVSVFIYHKNEHLKDSRRNEFIEQDFNTIRASLTKDSFSGMNTNHINLTSKENAYRYTVEIYGIDSPHPIYDSVYSYEVIAHDGYDVISFIIPEYPPKNITIDYAADMFTSARIEITAFYKTEKEHIYRTEKRELKVE
ncbi:hypothetical protein [Treponema sp.]|uniref:hypothetical protein n=1 Tax=Treponema sp. TaxID=166 RepID=UPI00388D9226